MGDVMEHTDVWGVQGAYSCMGMYRYMGSVKMYRAYIYIRDILGAYRCMGDMQGTYRCMGLNWVYR